MTDPHPPERVETVVEKIEYVERCLEILVAKQSVDERTYRRDPEVRDVVERRFEKATGACLDVARMLLRVLDHEVVYGALQDLSRYRRFLHDVRDYLERIDAI